MEPGVPFALLASAELLAVAAYAGIAAAVLFPRLRSLASPVIALGAVLLAVAEGLTGSSLGYVTSERLAWLRAAGAILLVVGLLPGAPRIRAVPDRELAQRAAQVLPEGTAVAAVIPLGAPLSPVVAAASALALAALAAVRRPAPGRAVLGGGLLMMAAASAAGVSADTDQASATAALALRIVGAVTLLAWLGTLARRSLLAKVVASILIGVLTTSVAVASIVGTQIADRLNRQQRDQVSSVAKTTSLDLKGTPQTQFLLPARVLAGPGAPIKDKVELLKNFCSQGDTVAAEVSVQGQVTPYPRADCGVDVGTLAFDDLANQPMIKAAAAGTSPIGLGTIVLQGGKGPLVVSVAAVHVPNTNAADVYGGVIASSTLEARRQRTLFDSALIPLAEPTVAASSLPLAQAAALLTDPRTQAALSNPPPENASVIDVSQGREPTLAFSTLNAGALPTVLLVVSAPASTVLGVQRTVLRVLFGALVVISLLVGAGGLILGRQVVEPIRRLTAAAESLRRGERGVSAGVRSSDEVGVLSRTFDAMTVGLAAAADELRAQAEQELSLRTRLETVLASITDGLVVADPDGIVTSVNPAAAALVGPAGDALGRRLDEVVTGTSVDGRPLAGDTQRQVEGFVTRRDGALVPVVVMTEPLSDGRGVVVVLRDMTRERQVERMKTEFLSNVSHELRTPLTPIQGYADLLLRRPDLPADQTKSYAGIVLDSSKRLARVVDLLVDVAALDAGRILPEPREIVLARFVDERLAHWRARVPARAADLKRRVSGGLPAAWADPSLLAKAVDELLDNALKYSERGAAVTLAATFDETARELLLSVRDNGHGVPEEAREDLFTDFAQADGSATRAQEGLGLGLAFVRRLAGVIGGRLDVQTETGHGSVFSLAVPLAPRAARAVPRPRRPRATAGA